MEKKRREEDIDDEKELEDTPFLRLGEDTHSHLQVIAECKETTEAISANGIVPSSESEGEVPSEETLDSCDGCMDFFQLQQTLKNTTRNHALLLKLSNQQDHQIQRMKKKILQTEREIKEMQHLLRLGNLQMTTLREESFDKEFQLHAQLLKVPREIELEMKQKEPGLHKKWEGVKNIEGAMSLLTFIKQKQRTFKHLELMTYQKKLSLEHKLNTATSVTSDKAGKSPPPPPPPRIRTSPSEQQPTSKKNAISVENLHARHVCQSILARVRNSSEPLTSLVRADGSSEGEETTSIFESEV